VVFSVREADELYRRALEKAWAGVEKRLRELTASPPGKAPELMEVHYDILPGESVIEELPDNPKSSRPQAVEVSVRIFATYRLPQ
jgi:hypothetical protein